MFINSFVIASVIVIIALTAIVLANHYLSGTARNVVVAVAIIASGGLLYFLYILETMTIGF